MESSPLFYKVSPSKIDQDGPYPALVLLHGRGTDETDLLGLAPQFDKQMLVISVRAPYHFPLGGYTWFGFDEAGNLKIDQLIECRNTFIKFLDEICNKFPIDPNRLFLFGFSMGAMMSLVVSLYKPGRFKGAVIHSGMLPNFEQLDFQRDKLTDTSFFIAHGSYDPVIPVELGRQAYSQLVKWDADVLYKEYPIEHSISEDSLQDITQWLYAHI